MQYDTIVVGLGSAGVTAASTLARAGKKVLGLEAQDRIGGRVNTVQFGDGVVELGAEWIHGERPSRVYDTAIKNNISIISQDLTMEAFNSDGSRADSQLVNDLINFCISSLDGGSNDTEPLSSFITRKLKDHLKETSPQLLENDVFMEAFLDLMDLIVDNYEGSNSWDDVSTYTHYKELEGDQHLSWHRNGYKTFFELLLNTYNGGPGLSNLDIKLNTEVTKINWLLTPSTLVEVTCKNGEVYKAQNVIITVSIGVLKERYQSLFSPQLPEEKSLAIERLTMGIVGKVVLSYPHRWWPKYNVFWFNQTKEEKTRDLMDTGYVTCFATVPMGSDNTITFWYSGETVKLVSIGHGKLFHPPLPKDKVEAIERLNIGVMDKIVFSFENAWWPKHVTFFAFLWKKEDKMNVPAEDAWTTRIFGASSPMGSSNTLTLWTSGESGKLVETLPEDVVKRKSVELLKKFLGANITVPEPTGMLRTTWYSNPYTRGSYSFDSVTSMRYPSSRADLGKPLVDSAGTPKVLFAGEATELSHFSTVHGASETGFREANRLLPSSKI